MLLRASSVCLLLEVRTLWIRVCLAFLSIETTRFFPYIGIFFSRSVFPTWSSLGGSATRTKCVFGSISRVLSKSFLASMLGTNTPNHASSSSDSALKKYASKSELRHPSTREEQSSLSYSSVIRLQGLQRSRSGHEFFASPSESETRSGLTNLEEASTGLTNLEEEDCILTEVLSRIPDFVEVLPATAVDLAASSDILVSSRLCRALNGVSLFSSICTRILLLEEHREISDMIPNLLRSVFLS